MTEEFGRESLEESPSFTRAIRNAYRLLAARDRSEKEMRLRLREKGYSETVVGGVTARLRAMGYLDDGNFARQWARHLAVNCLYGDIRIETELREKGITRDLTRMAINRARKEMTERQAVRKLLRKYRGEQGGQETDTKEQNRIIQRLVGKGFPHGLIFSMVKHGEEELVHDDDGQ